MRSLGSLVVVVLIFCGIGLLSYFNRYIPDSDQVEFDKNFERESVLVKTCGTDPGIATAIPIKVYRYEGKLWFRDRHRWRIVDGNPDNVCDLLDIEKGHEPKPGPLPPGWSRGR